MADDKRQYSVVDNDHLVEKTEKKQTGPKKSNDQASADLIQEQRENIARKDLDGDLAGDPIKQGPKDRR